MRAEKTSLTSGESSGSSLRVHAPDDAFEKEADRAADVFVRGSSVAGVPFSTGGMSLLQRCACGKKNAGGECHGCRKKRLQRRASSSAGADVVAGMSAPPVVSDVLGSSGRTLDGPTRARMEAHFGVDFSGIRLHTDARAAQSAAAVSAEAWTVGQHIAFAGGAFNPHTKEGQHLLAHELSHVVQQGDGLRRKKSPWGINPEVMDEEEQEKLWELRKGDYKRKVQAGELDDTDVGHWYVRSRLDVLKTPEIDPMIAKVKKYGESNPKLSVDKVVEYLEVRKEISTPMPIGASVSRDPVTQGVESYGLSQGSLRVTVVSDSFGSTTGNATEPTTNFGAGHSWTSTNDGKLVKTLTRKVGGADVPFDPTSLDVTIKTQYQGPRDDPSAYGKGTTELDRLEGTTTLRSHEGQHGTDYLNYLLSHPFPVDLSKGVVGVLTPAQMKQVDRYLTDFFKETGEYTCEFTDQVGTTQDAFLKTPQGKASGITSCRKR